MKNQEAARYARWAAMAAGAITVIVSGFYAVSALREYLARRHGPAPVGATVQQQTAGVTYSFSNQDGTTFTIRASHATQFKEGDHALLQDVWVTIYGKKGDRNDNIHTAECSYQPSAGNVQCAGDVEIDVQAASASDSKETQPLHVTTSNITFNRQTGEGSTPEPVNLTFPGGKGSGTGLMLDSQKSILRMERGVEFEMAPSDRTGGMPVSASAANLEFHRDDRIISLGGPVKLRQGDRELSAGHVSVGLDKQYHAQSVSAEGSPVLSGTESRAGKNASFTVTAQQFTGALDAAGTVQQLAAVGGVTGERTMSAGKDHFSAARVDFAMIPGRNLLKTMTASGGVSTDSQAAGNIRTLKTNALVINFAAPALVSSAGGAQQGIDKQRIESAETQGAATIDTKSSGEALDLKAAKFAAQFDPQGKLQKLLGHSGVQITRTPASGGAQSSTAAELVATFAGSGDWSTVDESGGVQLTQDGKVATAAHAQVVRDTNAITLDGSPVFSDASSRTSAGSVSINQKLGDIRATGGVISTELAAATAANSKSPAKATASNLATNNGVARGLTNISLGEGDAHISSDTLMGNINSGEIMFSGHARLWQGQAVLDANQITVARDSGTLQASGDVVAVFPQQAGVGPQLPTFTASKSANAKPAATSAQTVWKVRAHRLTYSNAQSLAHLDGGVTASSDQGSLQSQTLDVYLAAVGTAAAKAPGGLQRIIAKGQVVVSQNAVHGYAEQAEYDALRNKFTFSGGMPKMTDENGNTTTGRSLTFDVASDTISVDSDEGSRTLTRHRVEK